MEIFSLVGRVGLVTGAASGIGQRLAIGLAEAGADVVCFDRAAEGLAATVARIGDLGRRALPVTGDVTNAADLDRAVAEGEAALGPLRIAINAAGIADSAPAETMDPERWRRMIDVNLTGLYLSCRAEAQAMLRHGRGAIVNIGSISAAVINRGPPQSHYNAAKAGVVHLTKALAVEWSDRGLRVNAISPGYIVTPMNQRPEIADARRRIEGETPLGRMAGVDELVGPAIFLCSDAASFVTGTDLLVDGGFVCQ